MTKIARAVALACVVLMVCSVGAVQFGDGTHDSDGATDYDSLREKVSGFLSKTGEAGFVLELNDDEAMKVLDIAADTYGGLTLEFTGLYLDAYLMGTESPSVEGFKEYRGRQSDVVEFSPHLSVIADVLSEEESGNYVYTIRLLAEFDISYIESMGVDSDDVPMRGEAKEHFESNSSIVLRLNENMEFTSLSIRSNNLAYINGYYNYEYDGSIPGYHHSETQIIEESVNIDTNLLIESDGITTGEIISFLEKLEGGEVVVPSKDISVMFSMTSMAEGLTSIVAVDLVMSLSDLVKLFIDESEVDVPINEVKDAFLQFRGVDVYTTLQNVMESAGWFISEEEYYDFKQLIADRSDYYFETSEQLYNGEIKNEVKNRLHFSASPSDPLIVDDDGIWVKEHHAVLFNKDDAWNYVDYDSWSGSESLPIPSYLGGFEVDNKGTKPDIDQQIISGSNNTLWWNIEDSTKTIYIAGASSKPALALFKNGVKDDGLLQTLNPSVVPEKNLDRGWLVTLSISNGALFDDCCLEIKWNGGSLDCFILKSEEMVPEFDPTLEPEGFPPVVVNGVEYCYNIRGEAYIVGLDDGVDTVLFSREVVIDEVPYRVDKFYSLKTEKMTVVLPVGSSSVPGFCNCKIEELTLVCEGREGLTKDSVPGIIGLKNFGVIGYDSWSGDTSSIEEGDLNPSEGSEIPSTGDRFSGCVVYIKRSEGISSHFKVDGSAPQGASTEEVNGGQYYRLILSPKEHTIIPQFYENYYGDSIIISLNKEQRETFIDYDVSVETVTITYVNDDSKGDLESDPSVIVDMYQGYYQDFPTPSSKDGYRFVGWISNHKIVENIYVWSEDITLTAGYVPTKLRYDVIFDIPDNRGSIDGNTTIRVFESTQMVLPIVNPADGYRFNGWTVDGVKIQGNTYTVVGNVTFTADMVRISSPGGGSSGGSSGGSGGSSGGGSSGGTTPSGPSSGGNTTVDDEGNKTMTTTDRNGNTISTTIKTDGTVTTTTTSKDGTTSTKTDNPDGTSSTLTERKDGSSTLVEKDSDGSSKVTKTEKKENGSTVREEVFDRNGELKGSTTKETESTMTDAGTKIETVKTTSADGAGNLRESTTEVRAESKDGQVSTTAKVTTDSQGKVTSESETTIASSSEYGSITVDKDAIEGALKQMQEVAEAAGGDVDMTVTIATSEYTPEKADLTISSDDLKTIADAGADMKLAGDVGTVSVSPSASKTLASSGKDVNVSIGKASKAGLNPTQQNMVGDNPVFQLKATVGEDSVHELGGDVTVTVPYILKDGQDPDNIIVYYVDDDGRLHSMITEYDAATNTVSFVTDHFSFYMIGEVGIETTPQTTEGGNTMIYIAAAVAVVVVIAIVALVRSRTH